MSKISSIEQLKNRLKNILFKKRLVLFLSGVLITLTALVVGWIALSFIANLVILPVAVKISLLALVAISAGLVFGYYAIGKFFKGNIEDLALEYEAKHQELKGQVIAALQFTHLKNNPGYSTELIAYNELQALDKISDINFNEAVSFYPFWNKSRYFGLSLVVAVLLLLLMPGLFSYSYEVYSNPTEIIAPPIGFSVTPYPGSIEWVKYRDIEIGAAIVGDKIPEKAVLHHRLAGGNWQETEFDLTKERITKTGELDSLNINLKIRQINKSFDYYFTAGRVETEIQKVDVVDRPRVTGMKLSIFYPDYTGLEPTVIDENNGTFSALVGSRVNLALETNLPVTQAEMVFDDDSRLPLTIDGQKIEGALKIQKSKSYHIRLTDHLGEKNPDPIEFYITAVPDEYPSVEILRPGYDVNLNDDMVLPLKARIFDDFGFSSLVLKYIVVSQGRPSEENVAVLHYSESIKTEGEIEFNWDMDRLNLFPGDYVGYYFEVSDNDQISGPKISKSRQFLARLPSLEEIISQAENEGKTRITSTEEYMKSGKELAKRLEQISRKMQAEMNDPKNSQYENKKELKSILDQNAELMENIQKMAEQMDKSVEQLNNKAMMSQEIMDKMAQIQKLYEEIATPEMKEAQKKLMEALKNMNPQEIEQAMKDFKMSQDELMDRLDRTLALLKKMQLEQKMEAMIRQIEQMIKEQEDINQKADKADSDNLPELSEKEEQLKDSFEKLQKEADDLDKMARDAEMEQSPEVKDFKEALKKNDANKEMSQMSQSLQQKQKEPSKKSGERSKTKMMQMLDQMQKQLASMQGADKEKVQRAMRNAIEDANYLSDDQEKLQKTAAEVQAPQMMLNDLATQQQDLLRACEGLKNQISELGKLSPFVAAELEQIVNSSTQSMEHAATEFNNRNQRQAQEYQRESMSSLNKASLRLMESLEQQKQCNKGGTCDKNTSMMQSLSQKQQELNEKTQKQCNNPGDNMNANSNSEQRQSLKKLAAEQGSLRKSLEDLNREFAGSRQILGRLDDIAKEMKAVEEALESGKTGSEVTDRQIKVYSRMLEAARSLYRKDFSEQRQSKSATENVYYLPPGLSTEILNDKFKLEDRLKEYLGENYPPQYEEQIKAYFKAILQMSTPATDGQN